MAKKSSSPSPQKPKGWRQVIGYFLVVLLILSAVSTFLTTPKPSEIVDLSEFIRMVNSQELQSVVIRPNEQLLVATTTDDKSVRSYYTAYPELINELRSNDINFQIDPNDSGRFWSAAFQTLLPFILIAGLWFFIFRSAQGANNQAMAFGKSRAKAWRKENMKVTFNDVAGVDEAIEELKEIVDFLKSPKKYQDIGAKIPKGVLLMGPPGTGKTLLAKAVAGEADVPFFSISGSDFVEMFVGVGASRVRDLFGQAKKQQPCIIFLDEIDAVGRHRGAGLGGGHDEREQTLNQLLVEMDGFEEHQTIIVIAATNRPDILDPALQRPGRFDRQVVVDRPNIAGREAILAIHARDKKFDGEPDVKTIAKRTPGFTGADLANLMNEAALIAARNNQKTIRMIDVEDAADRIMAGPQRKSAALEGREKEIVAYHEVGHAIVTHFCKHSDPVHKITILPRGMALGFTMHLPKKDKRLTSREEIEDQIKVLLAGRIAEEMTFNSVTNGASDDIKRATELARNYVCYFGMSTKLGLRKYGKEQGQVFLGRDYSDHSKDYSEATAKVIDDEMQALINQCYDDAKAILTEHRDKLDTISKLLMEQETIDSKAFEELVR